MSRFFKYCIISKAKNIVVYTEDLDIYLLFISRSTINNQCMRKCYRLRQRGQLFSFINAR